MILISGEEARQHREKALAAGAVAFFEKPVPYADLLAAILPRPRDSSIARRGRAWLSASGMSEQLRVVVCLACAPFALVRQPGR